MHADARAIPVKDGVIRCCVTSPPYWRLRDYGVTGQIGMERALDEYVTEIVAVLREVRRVLTDDGTCWLNLGDRFKHKQLLGVPWRVAFALQADGWWLRSDIVWYKPNPMPESVKDRPTRAHEYVFLLTKKSRYYYNAKAIRTPQKPDTHKTQRWERAREGQKGLPTSERNGIRLRTDKQRGHSRRHAGLNNRWNAMTGTEQQAMGANARSVWAIAPEPFSEAHFGTFPTKLAEKCVLAGSAENDFVLDPFAGSGTVGVVCKRLNRRFVGLDLSKAYCEMACRRNGGQ